MLCIAALWRRLLYPTHFLTRCISRLLAKVCHVHAKMTVKTLGSTLCLVLVLSAVPANLLANDDVTEEAEVVTDSETKETIARRPARNNVVRNLRLRSKLLIRTFLANRVLRLGKKTAKLLLSRTVFKPARNVILGSAILFGGQEYLTPAGGRTAIRSIVETAEFYLGPTISKESDRFRDLYKRRMPPPPGTGPPAKTSPPETTFSKIKERAMQHGATTNQRFINWRKKYLPSKKPKKVKVPNTRAARR